MFNLIKCLSLSHDIDFFSFASEMPAEEQLAMMRRYCRRVEVVPYRAFRPTHMKALLGFISRRPRSVIDTQNLEMEELVNKLGSSDRYDIVIASQVDMAPYALLLANTPKILEELELTTLYERVIKQDQPLKRFRNQLTWWKLSNYVAGLLGSFAGCTVVSEPERGRLLQILPDYDSIEIVPNGVDADHYQADFGSPEPGTLIYSGALTYGANFDAMDFFLEDIFPLIQAKYPEVKLFITGKLDGVPVEQLPRRKNVVFTGYLEDIRPRIACSWLSIVPLRIGGGTRLKILESLAAGTPVISTMKGAEGLDLEPGRDLVLAEDPADFAAAVLNVLQDSALRNSLSRNGLQTVRTKYDWSNIGQRFDSFIKSVVSSTARKPVGE